MRILAIVILYNKEIDNSMTLNSLKKYEDCFDNIVIYNNGPVTISKHYDVEGKYTLINDMENSALSKIYNEIIANYDADRYVILDDDSCITDSYIENMILSKVHYDIGIPIIKSTHNNSCYYPVLPHIFNIFQSEYKYIPKMYSISSGLIISKYLAGEIYQEFKSVFDERFVLYGVDITLFCRLNKLAENGLNITCLSNGEIVHDLSKFHDEKSSFRVEELLIDQVLQYKLYHKNYKRLAFQFLVNFKSIRKLNLKSLARVSKVFITSKHPRA